MKQFQGEQQGYKVSFAMSKDKQEYAPPFATFDYRVVGG